MKKNDGNHEDMCVNNAKWSRVRAKSTSAPVSQKEKGEEIDVDMEI